MNKILKSTTFKSILQSHEIEMIRSTSTKQTDATQRWKILLRSNKNSELSIPTKIEFSHRKMDKGIAYAAIDSDVTGQYKLYPIICNHYEYEAAFSQKIRALIYRTETQARDIFDLKWLLDKKTSVIPNEFTSEEIQLAIRNTMNMEYEHFKGQVIAFLADHKSFYDSPEKWDEIRLQVIAVLEGIAHAPS